MLYKKTLGHPNLLQRLCDIIVNILLQQLNDQEALVLFKNYLKSLDIAINNKVINKLINRLGTFENLLQKFCNITEKHFLEKWPMSKLVESINLCMEIGEIELTSKDLKRLTDDINTYPQIFWKLIILYMNDLTNGDHLSIDENQVNLSIETLINNGIHEDFFRDAAINLEKDLELFDSYLLLTKKLAQLSIDIRFRKLETHWLSGAFRRNQKGSIELRNVLYKKVLHQYFDATRIGDIFAINEEWKRAIQFYKREPERVIRRKREDKTC